MSESEKRAELLEQVLVILREQTTWEEEMIPKLAQVLADMYWSRLGRDPPPLEKFVREADFFAWLSITKKK